MHIIVTGPASEQVFDMSKLVAPSKSKAGNRHPDHPELSMTRKAIRNRTRRRGAITEREFAELYKPIEEWDEEELARGRPRAKDGTFRGQSPQWLTREVHEAAMERFKTILTGRMREQSITAIGVVQQILSNTDVDEKGRPVVPASTQLDAAKWLIEHVVGKPKQTQEMDISVKLQAVLAHAMIGGVGAQAGAPGIPALSADTSYDVFDAPSWEEDEDLEPKGE